MPVAESLTGVHTATQWARAGAEAAIAAWLAAEAGLPMTHLATAFSIAHPGVASALIGVRTMDHLDGLDVTATR